MKRNFSKLIIVSVLIFGNVTSCDKKLDVTDKNNPTQESYFKTAAELQNGVNAI